MRPRGKCKGRRGAESCLQRSPGCLHAKFLQGSNMDPLGNQTTLRHTTCGGAPPVQALERCMNVMPPSGSKILVTTSGPDHVITVPWGSSGPMRYFAGLFLLFWLGGWLVGGGVAVSKLWSGGLESVAANGFLVFWLGLWALGAAWAFFVLYRLFRPSVAESLRLMPDGVAYDSGVPPLQMNFFSQTNQREAWKGLFSRRLRIELDRGQLQSLRLRETDSGNRLTVDANAVRLDVARAVSEVEREWLYQLLAGCYLKSAAPSSAPAGRRA